MTIYTNRLNTFLNLNQNKLSLFEINKKMYSITGINNFFLSISDFEKTKQIGRENLYNKKSFGDYQTPQDFADKICKYLIENENCNPNIVIEPTYGEGNFILSAIKTFKQLDTVYGIEIQKDYSQLFKLKLLRSYLTDKNIQNKPNFHLFNENFFTHDFKMDIIEADSSEILIIGNPPWITNSDLGFIGSDNLPTKSNFKKDKGIEAITGKGNFDIAEYIIIKMLLIFSNYHGILAILCKNSVAQKVVQYIQKEKLNIQEAKIINFDAKSVFDIACNASLFIAKFGDNRTLLKKCSVYDFSNTQKPIKSYGWNTKEQFVSDIDEYNKYKSIDGDCPFEWRQGVKHDNSKIMELSRVENNVYTNGLNETVELENKYIYPILKSSDLKKIEINATRKMVIITQKKLKEDTSNIKEKSPKLWNYLIKHKKYFDKRKSIIYKNTPDFSIFGIGDYSFKSYKIGVSGFYKLPHFALISPINNKTVMLDDTCYFIGFDDYKTALITCLLLNTDIVQSFLKSIAFLDSKRPYTKEILKRIDIQKIYKHTDYNDIIEIGKKYKIDYSNIISINDYNNYAKLISLENNNLF